MDETAVGGGGGGTAITIDGNTSDWSSIASISTSGSGGPTGLKAADNATYLYVLVTGTINTNYQIFIDTDNSTTAGNNEYLGTDWPSTGFDFMVENGTLYAHTGQGSGWNWNSLGAVTVVKSGTVIEMRINRSSLGTLASTIRLGAKMLNSSWAATGYIPTTGGAAAAYTVGSAPAARLSAFEKQVMESSMVVYPNPTADLIHVRIEVIETTAIEITLFDLSGRNLSSLHEGEVSAGLHEFSLNGASLESGLYIMKVMANGALLKSELIKKN